MVQNQGRPPQNGRPNNPQYNQQANRRIPYQNQTKAGFIPPGRQTGMIGRLVNNAIKNPIDTLGKVVNIIKILQ